MLENIRLSFQGVWSHKMRSLLTMLGIIIGIASIIAIASTIQGTNEQLKQNLLGAGNNTVNVKLCRSDSEYEFDDYSGIPAGVPVFTESDREKCWLWRAWKMSLLHQPELFQRRLVSEHESPGCVHHGHRQPLFQYLRL